MTKIKVLLLLLVACSIYAQKPELQYYYYGQSTAGEQYTSVVYIDTTDKPLSPFGNGWVVFDGISNLQFARSRDIQHAEYIYSATDSVFNGGRWSIGLPRKAQWIWGKYDGSNIGWAWGFGVNAGANILELKIDSTFYQVDTLAVNDSAFHDYRFEFRKIDSTLKIYVDNVFNASYTGVRWFSESYTNAVTVGHAISSSSYADPTTGALSPATHYMHGKIDSLYSYKYPGGIDSSVIYGFNEGAGQVIYDYRTYLEIDATTPDGYRGGSHLMSGWTNSRDSQDVRFSPGARRNTDNTIALGTGLWKWSSAVSSYIGGFSNGMDTFNNMIVPSTEWNRVNVTDGDWTDNGDVANDVAGWNGSTWSAIGSNTFFPGGSVTQVYSFGGQLFAGGSFTNAGGLANADYVAVYNGTAWDTLAKGMDNSVVSFGTWDGKLICGGFFNNSGSTAIASSVASWSGTSWSAVGTNDIGVVWALDTFRTQLYAGTSQGLYRLRGTTWDLINALGGATIYCLQNYHNQLWYGGTNGVLGAYDGDTNSMGVTSGYANHNIEFKQYGNDLYMASSAYRIIYNGVNTVGNKLFRWNGQEWSAVNYGADQRPEDLAVYNGDLVVSGDFYWFNGTAHNIVTTIDVPFTADSNPADTMTYEIETIEYYNRVTRDGGTIINLAAIDSAISDAKTNGYWGSIRSWVDPEFGIKKSVTDSTMKLYCLRGYDLIGTGGATYTANSINGNPALVFNGTNDYFTSPDISSGLTASEVFIVGQRDADPPTSPTSGFWKYGSPATDNHIPFTDGNIYDDWGTDTRKTVGNPTPSLASLFLYNVTSASGNFTARLNGTQIYNTGTNTFGFQAAPLLGKSLGAYYYKGKFGAMIILNTSATADQRTAINAYLNTRYSIY